MSTETHNELLLTTLVSRLERLEAIEAITQLKANYFKAWDNLLLQPNDGAGVAALFTEDAEIDLGELAGIHRGRAAIQECYKTLAGQGGSAPSCTKHLGANPVIEIHGDSATGFWQLLWLAENQAGHCLWSLNHYCDTYRKETDGQWRFSSLKLITERSPGPLSVHTNK